MIPCKDFYNILIENEINFFCGIPDTLLKDFCAYITDHSDRKNHIITANEGNAIAVAAGYYLSTGKIPLVYMQNSGLGNSVNPLTSLIDPEVFNIPVVLLIGWRGEPGEKDEPQHMKQGKITLKLLQTLGIPFDVLPDSIGKAKIFLEKEFKIMREKETPHAFVVRKGIFQPYSPQESRESSYPLSREQAIKLIIDQLNPEEVVVSTTGYTSRELFEYREALHQGHSRDFLTVGSMGHSSQIAFGIALGKPNKKVYCIDGDGAVLMHMGSLAVIGSETPSNLKHIIINNGVHDSVGGQETAGYKVDFCAIAKACGYKNIFKAENGIELKEKIKSLKLSNGLSLLEIRVKKGSRKDLGRPSISPVENKKAYMNFLKND